MRNRCAHRLLVVFAGLLILCVALVNGGCKRSSAPTAESEQAQDPNALVLQQIKQYQEESGRNMAAVMDQLKRQQSLQQSQAGDPALVRDLATARFFLNDAQKAAEAKNAESMTAALRPLRRVVSGLAADLPGSQIAQHLDRASYLLRNQQAIGSKEFAGASLELLAASDAAVNGRPAATVPDVLKDIEGAKAAADKASPAEALQSVQAALNAIAAHPLAGLLNRAQASVRGAQDALDRQAWPVVAAELSELDGLLTELSKTVAPQATPAATEKPASAAPAEQTPAATGAAPAVPAPVATSALPQAAPTPATATPGVAPFALPAAPQR